MFLLYKESIQAPRYIQYDLCFLLFKNILNKNRE